MKRGAQILVILILVLLTGVSVSATSGNSSDAVIQFREATLQGRYLDAVAIYQDKIYGNVINEINAENFIRAHLLESLDRFSQGEVNEEEMTIVTTTATRINGLLGIASEVLEQVLIDYQTVVQSRSNFATGEKYLAAESYQEAERYLNLVSEKDKLNYGQSRVLLTDVTKKWKNSLMDEAGKLMRQTKFSEAMELLKYALRIFPEDSGFIALQDLANLSFINAEVKKFEDRGDLKGAILYLDDWLSREDAPAELTFRRGNLQIAYRNNLLDKAFTAFQTSGYKEALSVLAEGMSLLESDEEFMSKRAYYQSFAPVSLLDLMIVDRGYFPNNPIIIEDEGTNLFKDNNGRKYSWALYSRFNAFHADNHYIQYNLGRDYVTFSATAFVTRTYGSTNNGCQFVFIGDGTELHRGEGMNLASDPVEVKINVTGVKILEIRLVRTSRTDGDNIFCLGEPVLYRH